MHMWGVVWTRRDNMHFDGKHKSAMAKWGYRYLQFSCRSFGYAYSLAPSRLIHGLVDLRENKLLKNTQTTTITFLSEYRRSERPLQTWCFIDISGGIMFIYLTQVEDIYILTTQFMTRTTHPPGTHYDYTQHFGHELRLHPLVLLWLFSTAKSKSKRLVCWSQKPPVNNAKQSSAFAQDLWSPHPLLLSAFWALEQHELQLLICFFHSDKI